MIQMYVADDDQVDGIPRDSRFSSRLEEGRNTPGGVVVHERAASPVGDQAGRRELRPAQVSRIDVDNVFRNSVRHLVLPSS